MDIFCCVGEDILCLTNPRKHFLESFDIHYQLDMTSIFMYPFDYSISKLTLIVYGLVVIIKHEHLLKYI